MPGMNVTTGRRMSRLAHILQSITDILTTPIGTRVMRRAYGSMLFDLIDQPDNGATRVRLYAACATAIIRWEKRVKLSRVVLTRTDVPGRCILDIEGSYLVGGQILPLKESLPLQIGAAA